ncbi:MAG: thiamine phosphate synthase [Acidobacteriota bacterium]
MRIRIFTFPNRLYAITDRHLGHLPHDEIVAQLLVGGARTIQIRDKESSPRELLEIARACLKLTRAVGARLLINDFLDVALAAGADGVHLGQDDLSVEEARAIMGPDKIIGLSTHTLDQFRSGLATSADYLAVGPIFATSTKENPSATVGLELLRQVQPVTDRPIVAIGGISLHRARRVIDAGADAVAVISALYPIPDMSTPAESSEISARVRLLLDALGD